MNGDDGAEDDRMRRAWTTFHKHKTHLLLTNQLETQIAADGATYQSCSLLGRGFAEPTGTRREETPGFPEYDAQKDGGNGQSCTRNL